MPSIMRFWFRQHTSQRLIPTQHDRRKKFCCSFQNMRSARCRSKWPERMWWCGDANGTRLLVGKHNIPGGTREKVSKPAGGELYVHVNVVVFTNDPTGVGSYATADFWGMGRCSLSSLVYVAVSLATGRSRPTWPREFFAGNECSASVGDVAGFVNFVCLLCCCHRRNREGNTALPMSTYPFARTSACTMHLHSV